MTIEEAYSFVKNEKTTVSKPGLTRIHTLLRLLGNPEQHMKLIHVVGTNGKGSVSAMLSSVLKAAGYRVGLMSSPYLYSLKDYYRLGGELPSDEAYIRAVETVSEACRLMNDDYPSEFELAVAAVTAYISQVIAFLREEEVLNHLASCLVISGFSITQLTIDVQHSLLLRVRRVFLQGIEDNGIVRFTSLISVSRSNCVFAYGYD